jgi:nitrogen fixation-related uncharacterized protein
MLTLIIVLIALPLVGMAFLGWTIVSARRQERQWREASHKILMDGELDDQRKATASIRATKIGLGSVGAN